jgi:methionyl aminopeptidase
MYKNNATPSFYKYEGFPGFICISVNQELIHGIASDYVLKKQDIVTFDIGVTYHKYICDAAFSVVLDKNNTLANNLHHATLACLLAGINQVKPNNYTGDISNAIEQTAYAHGYQVIKDYGGHGCGLKEHEDPIILNYGQAHSGIKLVSGMVLCIEPMLMIGSDQYVVDPKNN